MLTRTTMEPDPDARFICAMAHTSPAAHGEVVAYEQLVRGDDPRYLHAPHLFVPVGTPQSEWPTPFDRVIAQNEQDERDANEAKRAVFERSAKANRVKVEAPHLYRVTRDVETMYNGEPAVVAKGSLLVESDPFCAANPDAIEPVK